MDDDILEKLSALEHEQWCEWAGAVSKDLYALLSLIEKLDDDVMSRLSDDEKLIISNVSSKLERWDEYMVAYFELSEDVNEKDRVFARKTLDIINP